ncbi:hypothetical protein ACLIA0_12815 [Bacillaceae bacterium W0354]
MRAYMVLLSVLYFISFTMNIIERANVFEVLLDLLFCGLAVSTYIGLRIQNFVLVTIGTIYLLVLSLLFLAGLIHSIIYFDQFFIVLQIILITFVNITILYLMNIERIYLRK